MTAWTRDHWGGRRERDEWNFKRCIERHHRIFHQKGRDILKATSAEWGFAGLRWHSRLPGWHSPTRFHPAPKVFPAWPWTYAQKISSSWWWIYFSQFAFTSKRSSTDELKPFESHWLCQAVLHPIHSSDTGHTQSETHNCVWKTLHGVIYEAEERFLWQLGPGLHSAEIY